MADKIIGNTTVWIKTTMGVKIKETLLKTSIFKPINNKTVRKMTKRLFNINFLKTFIFE